MAKLKIYSFPDDVLKQVARPVDHVDRKYFKISDDMLETMYEAPGIGLAANQVGLLDRIIVIDTDFKIEEPEDHEEHAGNFAKSGEVLDSGLIVNKKPRIMINPEIVLKEGELIYCEGCLSVPEYTADVKRAEKIKVEYRDVDGKNQSLLAEGLLAVCIQHEIDHLDGKLFIDRLSPMKSQMVKKKLIRLRAEEEGQDEN